MNTYEQHMLKNSALPFVCKKRQVRQRSNLFGASNWHENIEILYITQGKGAISSNSQHINVASGDLAIINSNHLHAIGAYDEMLCFHYLIVDRSFCLENGFDTNVIRFNTLVKDEQLRLLMESLIETYYQEAPYHTLTVRSLVLRIMEHLCLHYSVPSEQHEPTKRIVALIQKAIHYIHTSYERPLSLEDVANFVKLSPYYLSHEFRKYTEYSFIEYLNRTRCEQAKQLIKKSDTSIGEIARQCGFENRSYFAKCFQKYIGMLPSEYRQQEKY